MRHLPALLAILLLASGLPAAERYAVLIGVEKYEHSRLSDPPLKYACDDAAKTAELLTKAGYHVTLLTDETGQNDPLLKPTQTNIQAAILAARKKCGPGDTLLVGLAGHGVQFAGDKDAYFCPTGALPFADETDSLVSIAGIYRELDKSKAAVKIILVDACRNDVLFRVTNDTIAKVAGDGPPAVVMSPFKTDERVPDAYAGSKAGEVRSDNALKMPLVWCPAGKFRMGSPGIESDRKGNEGPVTVTLTKGFWMGQTEVTRAAWMRVMQTKPWGTYDKASRNGPEDAPAVWVTWGEASEFCQKLTAVEQKAGRLPEGWMYALPTEAQWEYACRAGTESAYSFGDNPRSLRSYGWFADNGSDVGKRDAMSVKQKKANPWGLYDMHGNVQEWCFDRYADTLKGGTDPTGPATGSFRVRRGGSWDAAAPNCRSAFRTAYQYRTSSHYSCGFRVALVPVPE